MERVEIGFVHASSCDKLNQNQLNIHSLAMSFCSIVTPGNSFALLINLSYFAIKCNRNKRRHDRNLSVVKEKCEKGAIKTIWKFRDLLGVQVGSGPNAIQCIHKC